MSPAIDIIILVSLPLLTVPFTVAVSRLVIWSQLRGLFLACPPHPPLTDAVRREFQSFSIGIVSLGMSIHAAADRDHLHMDPAKLVRWFGMKPISIPWPALTLHPASPKAHMLTATLHMAQSQWKLQGPRWCLQLAEPAAT